MSRVYVDRNRMEKEQKDAMVMCSLILLRNSGYLLFDLLIACAKRQRLAGSRTFAYVSVGFRDSNFSSFSKGAFCLPLPKLFFRFPPDISTRNQKPQGSFFRQPLPWSVFESWDSVRVVGMVHQPSPRI